MLGDEFLERLASRFARVHPGKILPLDALREAFVRVGYKPALMKDIVREMSAEGSTNVDAAIERMVRHQRNATGWQALLATLPALDGRVLALVAQGGLPLSQGALDELRRSHRDATLAKARTALERLKRAGIVSMAGKRYIVDDPLLVEYLGQERA